jgi:Dolichyl-phosphate-mannose-protein mannosyltransferase
MCGRARWKRFADGPGGLRGLLTAARTLARRHWLFTVVLGAGLALRILTQVAYTPALVYIDSYRYLTGDSSLDPLGYLVLLWPLQRAGGLAAVAAAQHLLGLGMAGMLYALLLRRGMWRWAAALAAVPVLLDGYQLQVEQTIMPDTLFEALIVAGLTLLLWRPRPAAWQVALAGLALGVAVDVRQVGEVLIVPAVAFLLVRAMRWRRLTHSALLAAVFAVPVLTYMLVQLGVTGQFTFTARDSYVFYGRAAAAADCATLRLPPDERSLCPSPQVVTTLNIDGLVGDPAGPLLSYQPPPGMTIQSMAGRFERAVVRQQPMAVVSAIDRDFVKLFALTRDTASGDMPISRWQFQTTYPTYPSLITRRYVASIRPGGGPPSVIRPLAEALRDYQLHGGYTPGPLLGLAALAGLAGSCSMLVGGRRERTATATACLLFTATGIILLLASDTYEFSWRYQLPALVLLPPAGILGAAAAAAARRRWRVQASIRSAGAVHREYRPADQRRGVADQERDHVGDRLRLDRVGQHLRRERRPGRGVVDQLRRDRVHPDPLRAELDVERAGQVHQGRLAHAVGRHAGGRLDPRPGGHVHDDP